MRSFVLFVLLLLGVTWAQKTVQLWMCLERCGESIQSDLDMIKAHRSSLTDVSFEMFNLDANSTLTYDNFTDVSTTIQSLNLGAHAMVSTCCPWGRPAVIQYCEELLANPQPFIDAAIEEVETRGLTGINLDLEPVGGTDEDGVQYGKFLTQFSTAMHKAGALVSVDVASWDKFFNFPVVAASAVDRVITMDTYAVNFTTFQQRFNKAVAAVPIEKLVIGLENFPGRDLSDDEWQERFDMIKAAGVQHISLWQGTVPDHLWPFIDAFLNDA